MIVLQSTSIVMKNKIKSILIALFSVFVIYSCGDDDSNNAAPSGNNNSSSACINYTISLETVMFSSSCFVTNDSVTWDFGDGNMSNNSMPTHTYADTGSYQVSLKIEKAIGGTIRTVNETISVNIEPTCKVCKCSFPLDTNDSFFEFCGTSVQAVSWCSSFCYDNQFCSTCSDL